MKCAEDGKAVLCHLRARLEIQKARFGFLGYKYLHSEKFAANVLSPMQVVVYGFWLTQQMLRSMFHQIFWWCRRIDDCIDGTSRSPVVCVKELGLYPTLGIL